MWEIIRGNKCKSFLPLRIPSAHRLFCFAPFGNPIDCNLGLFNCISKNHPDPIKVPSTSHYTMAMELWSSSWLSHSHTSSVVHWVEYSFKYSNKMGRSPGTGVLSYASVIISRSRQILAEFDWIAETVSLRVASVEDRSDSQERKSHVRCAKLDSELARESISSSASKGIR